MEKLKKYIESIDDCIAIAKELDRMKDKLIGKKIEIERRYPRLVAKYSGRIEDIQLRNEKCFINVRTNPKEIKAFLIGSTDEKFAKDFIKHIKKSRIKILD